MYGAVRKIGVALRFHHEEIDAIRELLYKGFERESGDLASRSYAMHRMPSLMTTRLYSTQGMAHLILGSAALLFCTAEIASGALALFSSFLSGVTRGIVVGLGVLSLVLSIAYLAFRLRYALAGQSAPHFPRGHDA